MRLILTDRDGTLITTKIIEAFYIERLTIYLTRVHAKFENACGIVFETPHKEDSNFYIPAINDEESNRLIRRLYEDGKLDISNYNNVMCES